MGGGRGWAAKGRLKLLLGLFGLAMSPRSARHKPKHTQRVREMSHYHRVEFQTYFLVANLATWSENLNLEKQISQSSLVMGTNGTVNGKCMSVAISWANKME